MRSARSTRPTRCRPTSTRAGRLRAAYKSAHAEHERRVAAYNAAVERHRTLVGAHNAAVEAHNAATETLNARDDERVELERAWREAHDLCADPLHTLPESEAPRIRRLEERLAAPAATIAAREATVRCEPAANLQTVGPIGESLNLSEQASRLAAWYVWRLAQSPPEYRSPECRPGGALDRRPPGAAHWP